jgi:dTDP-4-amino-4,6-dideoxygalactose transaminase
MTDKIFVTKPFLPPLDDFQELVRSIWQSEYLTNGGPMHQRLEAELAQYLGVPEIALFNNGTIAISAALQALEVTGEVITTPFTFVATTNVIALHGCVPVFADIDPQTLNLDPAMIEAAITPRTTAIMPVHCYGNPCDVQQIKAIADRHGLKVIYDAAHAFGVRDEAGSVLNHGDMATLSFHATKVFNTFEGGAVVCHDPEAKAVINKLKNFGIESEVSVIASGTNGKMSEVHAAMGLAQLPYIDEALQRRSNIDALYRSLLAKVPGITIPPKLGQTRANFAYFPIIVDEDYPLDRDGLNEFMQSREIFPRRYFYPLTSDFAMYSGHYSASAANLPVATAMARRVLCLPMYPQMHTDDVHRVVDAIATPHNQMK